MLLEKLLLQLIAIIIIGIALVFTTDAETTQIVVVVV